LVIAADIAGDIWMDIWHGAGDHYAHILNTGKYAPSLILIEGIVELENVIERGC
jgi:hypothetical protein